ncbi:hypothetical protein A3D78_02425 [Candidatus Gottesmanbacteria bacterium RIFCSPHIGHO2_02_FULL_39_14]|uniref:Uncharacterized protein n=1 Tax=Candidatus Gottesmanbacteria bacterium RIFCSPHIGHO2_02_FULL_39_14 TaxID=1798383 RepID=A0A1F5ZXQ1_9BACT|nr:MAG: hypothetical protein A3D78_02425 [Candidatus Gottesmanbacteria bacterium RIFCSPHIGHO2_02_FULL_39_14]
MDLMEKDKITFSVSKKKLIITAVILIILFLPIPSYQDIPVSCPLYGMLDKGYNPFPCPPPKKGWVMTDSLFFRIADLIKNNLFYPPQEGQTETVPGEAGIIDSAEPGEE